VERDETGKPPPVRIAVVEDDDMLRELWREVLEADGYEVVTFADGGSFLHAIQARARVRQAMAELERARNDEGATLRHEHFDLAIIDLILPDMHGVTVIYEAKKHRQKCIAVTGSSETDRAAAALAGAVLPVEKPAAIKALRHVVKAALLLDTGRE
jgi:DNA-binding response OmpR family regulator